MKRRRSTSPVQGGSPPSLAGSHTKEALRSVSSELCSLIAKSYQETWTAAIPETFDYHSYSKWCTSHLLVASVLLTDKEIGPCLLETPIVAVETDERIDLYVLSKNVPPVLSVIKGSFGSGEAIVFHRDPRDALKLPSASKPMQRVVLPFFWSFRRAGGGEDIRHASVIYVDLEEGRMCMIDPNGSEADYALRMFTEPPFSRSKTRGRRLFEAFVRYVMKALFSRTGGAYPPGLRWVVAKTRHIHVTQPMVRDFHRKDARVGIRPHPSESQEGYCTMFASYICFNLLCTHPPLSRLENHLLRMEESITRKTSLRLSDDEARYLSLLHVRLFCVSLTSFLEARLENERDLLYVTLVLEEQQEVLEQWLEALRSFNARSEEEIFIKSLQGVLVSLRNGR